MVLGVERYRLKVKELAHHLKRSPDGMSKALARGILKRRNDPRFRKDLDTIDRRLVGE